MEIRNSVHLSIHATPKINLLDLTIEIQICASDVDWEITGSQNAQNRKIQKKNLLEHVKAKNLCVKIGKMDK